MDDRTDPEDRYRPLPEAELLAAIPVNENSDANEGGPGVRLRKG